MLLHPRYKSHISFVFPNQILYVPSSHPTVLARYSILIIFMTAALLQGHLKVYWSNSVQPEKALWPSVPTVTMNVPLMQAGTASERLTVLLFTGVRYPCFGSSLPGPSTASHVGGPPTCPVGGDTQILAT